ncbi:hypothetical protein D3C87_1235130 [compost metagenome]
MTFEQGELVHHQTSRLRLWQNAQRRLQGSTLQQPNGVPVQAKQLSHVQCGKALAGLNNRLGQTPRHAGIAVQPTDGLHTFTAITTANTPEQHAEAHRTAENR